MQLPRFSNQPESQPGYITDTIFRKYSSIFWIIKESFTLNFGLQISTSVPSLLVEGIPFTKSLINSSFGFLKLIY